MNLALFSCRSPYLDDERVYPPLGLLYLKSAVNEELPNVEVDLIDEYDFTDKDLFTKYDTIGVSVMTPQRQEARRILDAAKNYNPNASLIIGGPHALHYLEEVQNDYWSHIVPRDGQRSLIKILKGQADRIENDKMTKGEWASQPRPDRTSDKAREFLSHYSYNLQGKKAATMITATGCPEMCCLSGDTIIHTLDGDFKIKELVGKDVDLFTWDKEKDKVKITKGLNVSPTRKNAEMVRVWFDDGTFIDCTPDHKIMSFINGNQNVAVRHFAKEAGKLKRGDRVKAIRFYKHPKLKYTTVSWSRRKRKDLHRIIMEYIIGRELNSKEVVHHKDGNRENNQLDNLELVKNSSEHMKKHSKEISERMKKNNPVWGMSKKQRGVAIEKMKKKITGLKRNLQQRINYRNSKLGNKNPRYKGKGKCKSRIKEINDGLINHRVDRIEKIPNQDTYCLYVPFNHWFFANNILVHNSFCEDAQTAVRWSPIEKIAMELDDIVSNGNEGVYLFDDLFAIAMPKVEPIARQLQNRDLIYRCNGQARYFTKWGEDFAKLLAETGCVEIAFGHESGSQTILDNILKRTTVEQNEKSVEYARKHGIKVKSFILLGLPGETRETIRQTEEFLDRTRPDDVQFAVYMPFKGTKIRDSLDRGESIDMEMIPGGTDGEITGAYGIKGGETSYEVRTSELSEKELFLIRDRLVKKFKPKSHSPKWQDNFFDQWLFERYMEAK